jgi:hypothetical protein
MQSRRNNLPDSLLNKYKRNIDALLSIACPSIKYWVKKGILQEFTDTPELRNLQE